MTDHIVVGGGIVGLAVGHALLQRHPGSEVIVVEKESAVAQHQTGHNSGVIHSGVYYQPGSAKAELCVRGAAAMKRFCSEHGIEVRELGKLIVAIDDSEIPALNELERRALANGVQGVTRLDAAGIHDVEPAAAGISALHVPTTAVVDYTKVAETLASEISALGGQVILGFEVLGVRNDSSNGSDRGSPKPQAVVESVDGQTLRANQAVVCAGLQSDRLAPDQSLRIVPFRGSYFDLTPKAADLVHSMIYPVPDPRFPFLGIHFTRHIDDVVSCGPNAVVALARERYRRWALQPRDLWQTLRFGGSWKLARRYWRAGLDELTLDLSRRRYLAAARRFLPDLAATDLLHGSMGIRAQAVTSDGMLVDDFSFYADGAVLHVRNAPSPAATASLAIAERIVDELEIAR